MKNIFLIWIILLSFLLKAQDCTKTFELYNQILTDYYIHKTENAKINLDDLNFSCLNCSHTDEIYTIYQHLLTEKQKNSLLRIAAANKCYKVSDPAFQKIISENQKLFKKSTQESICDYLIRYEQVAREYGDTNLSLKCDSITYRMLKDILYDSSTTDIGCLFPILLHGSDLLPIDEIDQYESHIKRLVRNGTLNPPTGAYMLDRVYYTRFGKQKYGTMYIKGKEFFPMDNINKIDDLRKEIQLYPIEIVVQKYGVKRPDGYIYREMIITE